jgi:hypothetical protein
VSTEGPAAPQTPERADRGWARSDNSASELSECKSRPPSPREGAAYGSSGRTARALPASNFAAHEPEADRDGGHGVSPLSNPQLHPGGKLRAPPVTADSASSLDFQRLELKACLSKPIGTPTPSALEDAWFLHVSADSEQASETTLFTKMLLQQALSVVRLRKFFASL